MQVIITKTGELKQVSDGYARNYLFPHKLATAATPTAMTAAKTTQATYAANQQARQAEFQTLLGTLNATSLEVTAAANEQGKLFAAVHVADVLPAFQQKQLPVEADMIGLPIIKHTGDYKITVRVPGQPAASVNLTVKAA